MISEQNEALDTQHAGGDRTQVRVTDATSSKEEDGKNEQNVMKEEEQPSKRSKTSKSKKISEVEARRSKYIKSGASSSKKGRQRREDDTMAKLLAFKTKVLETKGGSKMNEKGIKQSSIDDSLAARMAKRMKQSEDEQEMRFKEKEAFISMPGYSGQVNDDQADTGGDWMSAKFKCKQHADNDTRTLDKIGNSQDEVGGDGRRMDDYVVLDEKKKNRGKGNNGHHKSHRHH